MAKQTKITVETDSVLILRSRISTRAWCPLCRAEAEMIDLQEAGLISNLDRTALQDWLNSADLHRSQTSDGSAVVCLNSLLAGVRNKAV